MTDIEKKLNKLKEDNHTEELINECNRLINQEDNSYAHFYLGEYYYSISDNSKALSHLLQVKEDNPLHNKAIVMQEMIKSVFNFFNKDLYNP
ncbi:MAG: hypothetical protein N4A49_08890 [Marinifilaceae bacterium]|jgi:hypothetical protein|nr:hypothetical protein [Marinifilaceae bacterium]